MTEKLKENIERFIYCDDRKHDCKNCKYQQKCYDELASYDLSFRDNVISYLKKAIEKVY